MYKKISCIACGFMVIASLAIETKAQVCSSASTLTRTCSIDGSVNIIEPASPFASSPFSAFVQKRYSNASYPHSPISQIEFTYE